VEDLPKTMVFNQTSKVMGLAIHLMKMLHTNVLDDALQWWSKLD
jgi:hypothetical protein